MLDGWLTSIILGSDPLRRNVKQTKLFCNIADMERLWTGLAAFLCLVQKENTDMDV